jgi:hypothetical protein
MCQLGNLAAPYFYGTLAAPLLVYCTFHNMATLTLFLLDCLSNMSWTLRQSDLLDFVWLGFGCAEASGGLLENLCAVFLTLENISSRDLTKGRLVRTYDHLHTNDDSELQVVNGEQQLWLVKGVEVNKTKKGQGTRMLFIIKCIMTTLVELRCRGEQHTNEHKYRSTERFVTDNVSYKNNVARASRFFNMVCHDHDGGARVSRVYTISCIIQR